MLELLLDYPGVRRAIALNQVGEAAQAEREIRKLAARAAPELMAGLLALSSVTGAAAEGMSASGTMSVSVLPAGEPLPRGPGAYESRASVYTSPDSMPR